MKKKVILLILSIITVLAILGQTTYSLLFKEYETDEQSYTTGLLEITSSKNTDSITLVNSFPMEDAEGEATTPYIFTITNVGNLAYKFDVKFLSTTTENMIDSKYIKIMVDDNEPVTLNSLTEGVILEDIILDPEDSIEIELRAWLDINTSNTEIGKVFNGKIVTEGIAVYSLPKLDVNFSNITVDNNAYQGIPTTGFYTLTSNKCSNLSYDKFTKEIKIKDFTSVQNCDLSFNTDTNYSLLNTMQVGDYVAYTGNNGCLSGASGTTGTGAAESGNSCKGYNANQPTDGIEDSKGRYGYCYSDSYHYTTYGWRIAYIEDNKVHLISAGSPECRTRTSSENNGTAITDLNTAALDYCNATYVDGGTCPTTASEDSAVRALGNTDFEKITYAISGTTSSLTSVYGSTICYSQYSYKRCGHGNDLLDNGGYYWFAAHNNSTNGVYWYPYGQYVDSNVYTHAYGFRPIIRLSSLVYVTGGAGTMDDPYTIGI